MVLEGWFNFSALPGSSDWDSIIDAESGGSAWCFQFNGSGGTRLNWYDGAIDYLSPAVSIQTGEWHHFVLTLDFGVTNGSHWYLDGVSIGSFTAPNRSLDPSGIEIGGRTEWQHNLFGGTLDEVRFSTSLQPEVWADWIATEYNNHDRPNKAQHPADGFVTIGEIEADRVCDLAQPAACGDTPSDNLAAEGALDVYEVVIGEARRVTFHTEGDTNTYGYLHGQVDPYTHYYKNGDPTWHRNDVLIEEDGHVTDLLCREAIAFIERNKDRPFFLYVPFSVPHYPLFEPEHWSKPYEGKIDNASRRWFAAAATWLGCSSRAARRHNRGTRRPWFYRRCFPGTG